MKRLLLFFGTLLHVVWRLLGAVRNVLANVTFLLLLLLVLLLLLPARPGSIPQGCALLLAPTGSIVEEKSATDPLARLINRAAGAPISREILLQDILDVIDKAAQDDRIAMLVLDPSGLERASLDHLQGIGRALDRFRAQGKKIVAAAESYDQRQYFLAAHADEVLLNPAGQVLLEGLAIYRLYARTFLEKLRMDFDVFRVGSYKSAVEPLLRDDMSPEDREANLLWLNRLWDFYVSTVAARRHLQPQELSGLIGDLPRRLAAAGGNGARLALEAGLVDALSSRKQVNARLIELVGKDEDNGFRHVRFEDYVAQMTPSYSKRPHAVAGVGIIIAHGDIVQGKGGPGQIGAESLGDLLREAAEEDKVAAVVLRLDTGGGGVLASELIRQEIAGLRAQGKPVVISMGSVAASGGYWIASAADRILAGETTLTGSIGIFGVLPNATRALNHLGLSSDGVATTRIAGAGDLTRPMPPELRQTIQLHIEEGYRRFLNLVAEGRSLPLERVEELAEGRVWDGRSALELGLVDELGGLDEAVAAAAALTGHEAQAAHAFYLEDPRAPGLGLLRRLSRALRPASSWDEAVDALASLLPDRYGAFPHLQGDPGHAYAHSLLLPAMLTFR